MSAGTGAIGCLVLVGGLGSRLRPAVRLVPKPMAPIAGKPFLEHLVIWLSNSGFQRVILCVGYLGEQIRDHFGGGERFGVQIAYSFENEPLGTWGAVRQAMERFPQPNFLVLNGDSFLQIEPQSLLNFHVTKKALATLAVVEVEDGSRFGSVKLGPDSTIREFSEKKKTAGRAFINGGVYCLSREILEWAPKSAASLEKQVFPGLIGHRLYGMETCGYFVDIGTPEEYERLVSNAENWVQTLYLAGHGGKSADPR